ncbi:PASTA domain-containing protein [bacterium]|nr:PASTA domain-containing protein [bacterium]
MQLSPINKTERSNKQGKFNSTLLFVWKLLQRLEVFVFSKRFLDGLIGVILVIIAAFWVIGLINFAVMPLVVASNVKLTVPDLRGKHVKLAEKMCENLGIELIRSRVRIDQNNPPAIVLDQFPDAGTKVKPGKRIEVILSVNEQMLLCPEVIGKSPREAELIADSSGLFFDSESIIFRHSSLIPEGVVLDQDPESITKMNRGDTLSVTVSLGVVPTSIIAPDLVGRNVNELRMTLAKYYLYLGKIIKYPSKNEREGTVISQKPSAGTPMKRYQSVEVQITVSPKTGD